MTNHIGLSGVLCLSSRFELIRKITCSNLSAQTLDHLDTGLTVPPVVRSSTLTTFWPGLMEILCISIVHFLPPDHNLRNSLSGVCLSYAPEREAFSLYLCDGHKITSDSVPTTTSKSTLTEDHPAESMASCDIYAALSILHLRYHENNCSSGKSE